MTAAPAHRRDRNPPMLETFIDFFTSRFSNRNPTMRLEIYRSGKQFAFSINLEAEPDN
jgi:hypothetical protein